MNVTTSAPGKLFLLGEYAVLAGGTALLTAVDRRAFVRMIPSKKPVVRLAAAGRENCAPDDVPILQAALTQLTQGNLIEPGGLKGHSMELDTSAFFSGKEKLGLGASAALMVAIVRALCTGAGEDERTLALAMACHRRFQGGSGSGADVAVALTGGTIRFVPGTFPRRVALPGDLHMLFVWTGSAAATPAYVRRLDDWRRREPVRAGRHLEAMAVLSGEAVDHLEKGRTAVFIDRVDRYNRKLMELSEMADLGAYSREHHVLRETAKAAGCCYKPSGAGGGDFGIVFSTDGDRIHSLKQDLERRGYTLLLPADHVPGSEVCIEE